MVIIRAVSDDRLGASEISDTEWIGRRVSLFISRGSTHDHPSLRHSGARVRQSTRQQTAKSFFPARKNQGGWSMEVVLFHAQY